MDRATAVAYARVLKAVIGVAEVSKILSSFVAPFLNRTVNKGDGCIYIHGNFNLGGTVSGRLSSSKINLQNLPSTGSIYAKLIKGCFIAPEGWILCGADFSSLEDKISALTTRDPNKIKVYTDGYDGHCLRAYAYFGDKMPGICNTVASINSIETLFPALRQLSKAPTFSLTYQGTHISLMGLGFTKPESLSIEHHYHDLYQVSDEWVQDKLIQASHDGYTTVAFGLRLRTPILAQVIMNTTSTPYEAQSEGRTVGNAQGQSYGLLNNRAAIELHTRQMASEFKYAIKPIAHIHDAQYFLVKEDIKAVKWLNDNLVECMEWQGLPEIQHPTVKLGGQLSIFYPDWSQETKLPNKASEHGIITILRNS